MDIKQLRLREIGSAIARERSRQGLNQTQLSYMIGNSNHSYLSRVESGLKVPSLIMIFKVADALDVNINRFFTRV